MCDHEWSVTPNNIKNGHGCPPCGRASQYAQLRSKGLKALETKLENSTLKILHYPESKGEKVRFKCRVCKTVGERGKDYLGRNPQCPTCVPKTKGGRSLSTTAEARFNAYCATKKLKCLSYGGTNKPARIRCLQCKNVFDRSPSRCEYEESGCLDCDRKNYFKYKEVTVKGHVFHVQGYEPHALRWLAKRKDVKKICASRSTVRNFHYTYKERRTIYYPDFQVGRDIYEVKSLWTAGLLPSSNKTLKPSFTKLKRKAQAVIAEGYEFNLLLLREREGRVQYADLPSNWYTLKSSQVKESIKWRKLMNL